MWADVGWWRYINCKIEVRRWRCVMCMNVCVWVWVCLNLCTKFIFMNERLWMNNHVGQFVVYMYFVCVCLCVLHDCLVIVLIDNSFFFVSIVQMYGYVIFVLYIYNRVEVIYLQNWTAFRFTFSCACVYVFVYDKSVRATYLSFSRFVSRIVPIWPFGIHVRIQLTTNVFRMASKWF